MNFAMFRFVIRAAKYWIFGVDSPSRKREKSNMGFFSFSKGTVLALTVAALLGWTSRVVAVTTDTLQHLVDTAGSLAIGDKIFNNFNYFESGLTSFDASQIHVTASVSNGIYFLTWDGNISLVSGGAASGDLLLNYRVTATAGAISAIGQLYTGSAQPQPGSFLAIDETVRDTQGNLVANSHLDTHDMSDPAAEPGDNLNLSPAQKTIDVTKDIALGTASGGFVSISEIRQSFTQVPEAATTALLAVGFALMSAAARRKTRNG
jgi:hypothetical protein